MSEILFNDAGPHLIFIDMTVSETTNARTNIFIEEKPGLFELLRSCSPDAPGLPLTAHRFIQPSDQTNTKPTGLSIGLDATISVLIGGSSCGGVL